MVLTREKKKKKKRTKIIRPIRSERGVNFAPKFPPFIGACSLQRHFADIQRGRFFSKHVFLIKNVKDISEIGVV